MPSLSEVWSWVSGFLPDVPIFGFEVSWPVYTVSGFVLFFTLWKFVFARLAEFKLVRDSFAPEPATKKGQEEAHDKLDDILEQLNRMGDLSRRQSASAVGSETEYSLNAPAEGSNERADFLVSRARQKRAELEDMRSIVIEDLEDAAEIYEKSKPRKALEIYRELHKFEPIKMEVALKLSRLERSHGDGVSAAKAVLYKALMGTTND